MQNNQNPSIRFKGFTEPWEQRKLSDSVTYRNGKAHESSISQDGKYVVVNSKFVSTSGEIEKFSNVQIEPLCEGEIAFVLSDVPNGRALARTYLIEKNDKYTLNQRIAGLTPNEEMDNYFLYILLNRNRYFLSFDDGAKQTNLSISDVLNFEYNAPTKDEQIKIGNLFRSLDQSITLHQRKCEILINTKKALLEKMFPTDSEITPKIRFKGFTEPWEQRKVQELFKITRGYVLAVSKTTDSIDSKNVYPVYSSQTANNGLLGYFDKYLYENAITWTTDGANAGTVNFRAGKFYCTNVCGVLITDKQKASTMFSYALGKVTKHNVSYVGNPKLMNNVMGKIEIKFAVNKNEQEKISQLFETLDNLITLHQRE